MLLEYRYALSHDNDTTLYFNYAEEKECPGWDSAQGLLFRLRNILPK